jgi:protein-disulfide isomerase
VKEYHGNVRVVFKNMVVHPQVVMDAHKAGCAAAKQGKFVAFKNAFWEKAFDPYASTRDSAKLGEDNILAIARDLGLDAARLKADMTSTECEARIEDDMQELSKFHVNSTPTFFINGKHLGGALPKEEFKKLIDEQLKIAKASGIPGADYYDKVVFAKGEKQFRSKKASRSP